MNGKTIKQTTGESSISQMDTLTESVLEDLEQKLYQRGRLNENDVNEMTIKLWEEELADDAFAFVNASSHNKLTRLMQFVDSYQRIERKINNGDYDNI